MRNCIFIEQLDAITHPWSTDPFIKYAINKKKPKDLLSYLLFDMIRDTKVHYHRAKWNPMNIDGFQ